MVEELKYKPLVEAIFEVRWKPQGQHQGAFVDPYYKLLLARLSDRLSKEYPAYEELPSASIPEGMVGYVVQHRFRVEAQKWPLIQVGPGIFTVNSTADYSWADFRPRIISAIHELYTAHPKVGELHMNNIILRYIDAVDFDYNKHDAYAFIQDKLKMNISISKDLLSEDNVCSIPNSITWHTSFKCNRPLGRIALRFATGMKGKTPAIIWETIVESAGDDMPNIQTHFEQWIDLAHELTDDWFFKMIDGELLRRFKGE